MFVPLNTYSCYSLLRGVKEPGDLVHYAVAQGMQALALTDWGYLSGVLEFYQTCIENKIKPIIGLTLPVQYESSEFISKGNLVFLAKNYSGWKSLCRLSSALFTNPICIELGAVPFSLLSQESQDLICMTGGKNSLVFPEITENITQGKKMLLHRLMEIFPENLFVQFPASASLILNNHSIFWQAVNRFQLPPVFAPELYFFTPEEKNLQRLVVTIRNNTQYYSVPEEDLPNSVSSYSESVQFASDLKQQNHRDSRHNIILDNTFIIADQCNLELPLGKPLFPEFRDLNNHTAIELLRKEAYSGANKFYEVVSPEIESRLEHELQIIDETGFVSLFLIMADVIKYAHKADIPTASRGSASSSLVAHCLGITTPDPMRLNLYFERFINPARTTPPDIDTDVCSTRRDQLIDYVYQTYGQDKVAMVSTINRFRRRSALRETAKAFGLTSSQIKHLINLLPGRRWGPPRADELPETDPYAELRDRFRKPPYPQIFDLAAQLRGLPHHLSIHPGGLVISPEKITNLLPTLLASKGISITQFDLKGVEQIGLVKIDLLGIRGLTVLGDMADYVRNNSSAKYESRLDVINRIPFDDNTTSDLVKNGQTIGCFQIESPGMRATLKEIQAETIDDIMIALALYRPGPMSGGLKEAFIRRHLGTEKVQHFHPALASLLSDTYGVILYQEQVLRIAHELAGLSLADADLLRRAMSHFDPGQQMVTLRRKFIDGAEMRYNIPNEISERIWELMAAFAGYGFPKAHAASYAEIAWRSAWFKSHFPGEFLATVLANWGGYYSQRMYINEARHLGLKISTPDVNFSEAEFCSRKINGTQTLFMGLNQVKELTKRTQRRIISQRPFQSFAEFLQKVDPRPKEAENLAKAGALSAYGHEAQILWQLDTGNLQGATRQLSLFPHQENSQQDDWTPEYRTRVQEEILGICVDHHPLELVSQDISSLGIVTTIDALSMRNTQVKVAGLAFSILKTQSYISGNMYTFSLEDMVGSLQIQLETQKYRQFKKILHSRTPIVVEGEICDDELTGDQYLTAEKIWAL